MNHKPYLNAMQAALDGELPSVQRRELAEHLAACPGCQSTWDALNNAQRLLKAEPLAVPRPGFTGRFRARLAVRHSQARLVWGAVVLGFSALSIVITLAVVGTLALGTVVSAAQAARQPAAVSAFYSSSLAAFTLGTTVARALLTVFDTLAQKVLINPLTWLASLAALAVVAAWGYLVLKLSPEVVLQ
jgi:predicted anti-sigma-YlaC factor YlaD